MASRALDPDTTRQGRACDGMQTAPQAARRSMRPIIRAAALFVALPGVAYLATPAASPRWAVMWAMAFGLFYAGKAATWFDATRSRNSTAATSVGLMKHVGYFLLWPGMNAKAFLYEPASRSDRPTATEWYYAGAKAFAGFASVALACLLASRYPDASAAQHRFAGWLGMVGFVVAMHFGVFHITSCAWRMLGINAQPLMREPLLSTSVSDFWSSRWNIAFRDLTHRYLFKPLSRTIGLNAALFAGFFASGLMHELVITVPAQGGFGGPTAYFLLQACAIAFERSSAGRSLGLGRNGLHRNVRSRLFTAIVLIAPVPLLFPPTFVENVALPWLRAMAGVL